jgi:23S rRNA (uridine2552-2'-O)-methyltransferase
MLAVERPLRRAALRPAADADALDADDAPVDAAAAAARARLAAQKRRVPATIEEAGRAAWAAHVDGAAAAAGPGGAAPLNRAVGKLREIWRSCALPPPRGATVHLCEAPGGFVQATAWRAAEDGAGAAGWRWAALSRAAGGGAPAMALAQLPTARGAAAVGDVRDEDAAVAALRGALGADAPPVGLATADGAVEMDHARLEAEHLPLLRAQVAVACRLLAPGGTLVLKAFELLEHGTAVEVARLTHAFEAVSVIKPTASRATNSERYVVARGFRGAAAPAGPAVLGAAWRAHLGAVAAAMADEQAAHLDAAVRAVRVAAARGGRGGAKSRP